MDRRDQELLDKQTRGLIPPPRHDGVMALAIAAVFFAGMTFGGYLFADKNQPLQIASNGATPAIFLHDGAALTRH